MADRTPRPSPPHCPNAKRAEHRKRHVQLGLELRTTTWGGKRKGAGRPPRGPRSSEPHKTRPFHAKPHPVHVVIRVERDLGTLRRRDAWQAIRWATIITAKRGNFHIVHASVQRTHVHLMIEADDRMALARGMQGFQISAAKRINRAVSARRSAPRKGRVFCDRYHARALKSPLSVRHAVAYVLNNWRHHREPLEQRHHGWRIDPYSSGYFFDGWRERHGIPIIKLPPNSYDPLFTWRPRTWLLSTGWRRHGAIGMREVPGS